MFFDIDPGFFWLDIYCFTPPPLSFKLHTITGFEIWKFHISVLVGSIYIYIHTYKKCLSYLHVWWTLLVRQCVWHLMKYIYIYTYKWHVIISLYNSTFFYRYIYKNYIYVIKLIMSDVLDEAKSIEYQPNVNVCRICYGNEEEERLVAPCKCAGSVQFMHQSCLMTWLQSSSNHCELCKVQYQIRRKLKLSKDVCFFVFFVWMLTVSGQCMHIYTCSTDSF